MYPNQQNQQNNSTLPPPQNPNNQHEGQNGQANASPNYDWINNYPTANQPATMKDNGFKKKIIFLLILLVVGGSAVLFASLSTKKDPEPVAPNNQDQNAQNDEQQNESESENNSSIDDQRKQKLREIHKMLESYYTQNKQYPTFKNVTDEAWLSQNDISKEDIADPESTDWQPKATPTKNSFAYQPKPENCDNQETKCTKYTITTILSNGLHYDLTNDN